MTLICCLTDVSRVNDKPARICVLWLSFCQSHKTSTKMRESTACFIFCLCLPYYTLYQLLHFPCELARKAAAARKYRASIPKALPLQRRRLSSFGDRPRSLSNSLLLAKLPLEIRLEIYDYVLGGQPLHIVHLPKRRLAHMLCCKRIACSELYFKPDYDNRPCSFTSEGGTICDIILRPRTPKQSSRSCQHHLHLAPSSNQLPALLRACRQTYVEAVGILYSSNTFILDSFDEFIWFSRSVISQRLQTIRNLRVNFAMSIHVIDIYPRKFKRPWERLWHIVEAEMISLRNLSCYLRIEGCLSDDDQRLDVKAQWVQPILKVRGLTSFQVAIITNQTFYEHPSDCAQEEKLRQHLQKTGIRPRLEMQ